MSVACWKQMACHACNGGIQQQHRLSGQSYESGVSSSSRQSYHSSASTGSSSSQGSLDRLEESGYSSTINVHELMRQGRSVRLLVWSCFHRLLSLTTCLVTCFELQSLCPPFLAYTLILMDERTETPSNLL